MIKCSYCEDVSGIRKAGHIRGNQRYFCKYCNKHFVHKKNEEKNSKQPKGGITIKDLAAEIGVSISTVSRALNDSKEIHPETKRSIIKKAEELDYQKNLIATSLVLNRTFTIGIIVPELKAEFYTDLINGANEILRPQGYKIFSMQSNESYEYEVANTKALITSRVDGIIASTTFETSDFGHFEKAKEKNIPVAFFSRINNVVESPKIVVDNYLGATMAVEHLIEKGYKKIGFLGGGLNFHIGNLRYQGFVDTLKKHGIEQQDKWVVKSDELFFNASPVIQKFLLKKDRPDALFTMSDGIGIEVINCARQLGIDIPNELGVIGFSDHIISKYISPGLSTIKQPTREIGMEAAHRLLKAIENRFDRNYTDNTTTIFNPALVARGSTDRKN
jgi:LacI family transcriptional regulator/LacI family repressor for deo operon, udp, cdd, tsx, nupC, and nupG